MTKLIAILCGVTALATLLGFAYFLMSPSHFELVNPIGKANAQETPAERAHDEENKTNNVQNGFSPINPQVSGSIPKQPANIVNLSLLPQNLIKTGSPLLGSAFAPVTIVEFGDFQCEFCDRFAKVTEPNINTTYIQTGKANMIFKNFVTHGPDSVTAAIGSLCANDQDKFWNLYETLYKNQGAENSGWANANNLKKFASLIPGINIQEFNSCLDNNKHKPQVNSDYALAISSGFQGTPTFVIEKKDGSDKQTLLGAYPFPSFQAIIDKELGA